MYTKEEAMQRIREQLDRVSHVSVFYSKQKDLVMAQTFVGDTPMGCMVLTVWECRGDKIPTTDEGIKNMVNDILDSYYNAI